MFEVFIASYVYTIKSDRILLAALEDLGDEQTLYTGPDAALRLSQDLKVKRVPDTNLISISLTGSNPAQVTAIVRAVLVAHVEDEHARRTQDDAESQQPLRAKRDDLRQQLDRLGMELSELRRQGEMAVADERDNEAVVRLTALARLLPETQCELAKARTSWMMFHRLFETAEETKDLSPVLEAFSEIQEDLERDPVLLAMQQELARLEMRAASPSAAAEVKADLRAAQEVLKVRRAETLARLVKQHGAALKQRYDNARELEAELLDRIAEARSEAIRFAQRAAEYRRREEEFRRVQALLHTVSDRLERMRIESALARPGISTIKLPMIPIAPD